MTSPRRTPPPWLFALSGMPYGVVGSFSGAVMPYFARRSGAAVEAIGIWGTLLLVPSFVAFLYAPIVDLGPKRKHWLVIVAALAGACLFAACTMPLPQSRTAFLSLAVAASALSSLVSACNGGLMASLMTDDKRGKAGAFYNVGNLSGGALSAAVAVYMTNNNYDPVIIGVALASMLILPSLAILSVQEPVRDNTRTVGEVFSQTLGDVKQVLGTRKGVTGLLLCMSPVGTAALTNYFSAFGTDYNVSDWGMTFITGPANAGLTALGALLGGWLCDRYNRRAMYLTAGSLTAACGLVMMLSPRTELTFMAGFMAYLLVTGFCYAAFTATVLETIGEGSKTAATQYSMFTAAGNIAISYVGFVDTRFHKTHGVEGVVGSDALLNIAGVVLLGCVFWKLGLLRKRPAPAPRPGDLPTAQLVERD